MIAKVKQQTIKVKVFDESKKPIFKEIGEVTKVERSLNSFFRNKLK